jgi:hypothetical protein
LTSQLVGNAVLILAALPALLFVILYGTRSRWEDTALGRQTMAMTLVIALVLGLSIVRAYIGESNWFYILRLIVFAMIVPTLWWRLFLLVKAQRQSRMDRKAISHDEESEHHGG